MSKDEFGAGSLVSWVRSDSFDLLRGVTPDANRNAR